MIRGYFRRLQPALLLVLLGALGSASPLYGQALKGTILGTVTDISGAVVPGVQVTITETGTNATRSTATGNSGLYAFANLDPGVYRVDIQHEGFRSITRAGIELAPNNTVRINLELQPGAVTETVDVTATAPILKTDRADTGGQIEPTQLQNMPLGLNRNYAGTLVIIPGVARPQRKHSEFYNSQDSLSTEVNGQTDSQNNFQIEGIDNNVENGRLTGIIPPVEAIQTVDVTTGNYDVEFGRASGAVVNVTLRSGTNDFHGALFHFHANENLKAVDVFGTIKAPTVYNQFGGALGGPIVRDKTFFFVDYLGNRDHKGDNNLETIPNVPFRSGDFSGAPTTIYDPLTGDDEGRNRIAFPNNIVPSDRISPVAKRMLGLIDMPTRDGDVRNFEKASVRVKTLNQVDTKFDHVITDNDRFMGRYSIQQAEVADPGLYGPDNGIYGGPHNDGFHGKGPARTQSLGLNYSRVWSPTLVSEIRAGLTRNHNHTEPWDYGTTAATDIGVPGANLDLWSSGLPSPRLDDYSIPLIGTKDCIPWVRANTNMVFHTNWTKTAGTHVIKWGYNLKRYRRDLQQTDGTRGNFDFEDGPTSLNGGESGGYANTFASFLLDYVADIERESPTIFPTRRDWVHSPYVADKWQVTPRLTLDIGVRWEYWPSSKPAAPGGFAAYNPDNNTIEIAGLGNIPMNLGVMNNKKSFAPRLGMAFRLNPVTVFRAGYGISYNTRTLSNYSFPIKQGNFWDAPNSFSWAGRMEIGVPRQDLVAFPANGILDPAPPTAGASPSVKDRRHPYVQTWNASIQRSLPGNFTLDVAYVGSRAISGSANLNYNASPLLGCGRDCQPWYVQYGRTASVNYPVYDHQWYNALQVKFDRRFSGGFMMTTAYTYSRNIDQFLRSAQATPGEPDIIQFLDRKRADIDYTHIFTQSYIYQLPFGRGKRWGQSGFLGAVLGGWQINALLNLQSGAPLDLGASSSRLQTTGHSTEPNLIGSEPVEISGNVGPGQLWFDTSRFESPPSLTFGNFGQNVFEGPGVVNLDASLFRRFQVKEGITMEFRFEALNATNTPHFGNPNTSVTSSSFGQITDSRHTTNYDTDNRRVQLGLRLFF